jgi:hypothetical protein
MKLTRLLAFAFVAILITAARASAIDEGQTLPRLSTATITSPNTTVSLVPTTSGSGNLKGINCTFDSTASFRIQEVDITVDGGTAQAIYIDASAFAQESSGSGKTATGFIPMNIRFGTSLLVQLKRASSPATSFNVTCVASWALD